MSLLQRLKIDGFLLAIVIAIVVALTWPAPAVNGGVLHLDRLVLIGMGLIFFFHGSALAPQSLKAEAGKWRLHLLIQATTFVLFPLLAYAAYHATSFLSPEARLGLFFLGAVSTTISSSITMTSVGKGNVAIAIFNATLSGLLGLLITPLLISALSTVSTLEISLADALSRIFTLLLLPFIVGQLLRPWLGARLQRYKRQTSLFERGVIVAIVLNAFANVTASGLWSQYDAMVLLQIAGIVALMLAVVILFTRALSRWLRFPHGEEVAFVFCGSTKSLANGAPMAQILFGSSAAGGLILLPLILYHQLQLIVTAVMAGRYARAAEAQRAS